MKNPRYSLVLIILLAFGGLAAAEETVLLGPERLDRVQGQPETVTFEFPAQDGFGTLLFARVNASDPPAMAKGRVDLNGARVAVPGRFDGVSDLRLSVLFQAQNTLQIRLIGSAGTSLEVTALQETGAEGAAVIGPRGGRVAVTDPTSPLFGTTLVVPPRALAGSTLIRLDRPAGFATAPDGFDAIAAGVRIGPEGTVLRRPAELQLLPSPAGGPTPSVLRLDTSELRWHSPLGLSAAGNRLTVAIDTLGTYGLYCGRGASCAAYPACGSISYAIDTSTAFAPGYTQAEVRAAVQRAIGTWSRLLGGRLQFRAGSWHQARLRIAWSPQPGDGSALFLPLRRLHEARLDGGVELDARGARTVTLQNRPGLRWSSQITDHGTDVRNVESAVLRLVGHALGLEDGALTTACWAALERGVSLGDLPDGCVQPPALAPLLDVVTPPSTRLRRGPGSEADNALALYGACAP